MRAHTFYFLISLGAVAFAQTPDLSGLPTCAVSDLCSGKEDISMLTQVSKLQHYRVPLALAAV